jgi:hypothetical protein
MCNVKGIFHNRTGHGGIEVCQDHASTASTRETTWYQFYRRLGESQGQSGRVGKILPSPVFGLRTVCPVEILLIYKNNTYILWMSNGKLRPCQRILVGTAHGLSCYAPYWLALMRTQVVCVANRSAGLLISNHEHLWAKFILKSWKP